MSYDEDVVRALSALEKKYEHLLEKRGFLGIDVGLGWIPIVEEFFEHIERDLTPFERKGFRLAQGKQKWGDLRLYYHVCGKQTRVHLDFVTPNERVHAVSAVDDPLSVKIDKWIEQAADRASRTCEVCGQPGKRRNSGGYVHIACEKHAGRR